MTNISESEQPGNGKVPGEEFYSVSVEDADALRFLDLIPIWVVWNNVERGGKATKVPFDPKGGMAKPNDPSTWGTREDVETAASKIIGAAIGIILAPINDTLTLAGIDLDTCRDPVTGAFADWARVVIERFASYTEVSPSGTGAKIFFLLPIADLPRIRAAFGTGAQYGREFKRPTGSDHPPAIEVHIGNRFFTVTGQRLAGTPDDLRPIDIDDMLWLLTECGPAFASAGAKMNGAARPNGKDTGNGHDKSRSAKAMALGAKAKRNGETYEQMVEGMLANPYVADWVRTKGMVNGERELKRIWERSQRPSVGWVLKAQLDKSGNPTSNLHNALLALREDDSIANSFAYDEMLRAAILVDPAISDDENFKPRAVTDNDVTIVQEYLQRCGLKAVGKDTTHQAVDARALECSFHPVRKYLDSLVWDGVPRVGSWVVKYFGAEDITYHCAIGQMFIVAMVARIYEPGCKADYMMVLEGPQGTLKSTACAVLGGEWFSDSLPDIRTHGKDVAQHLNGKWLIEVAEMSALDKAESAALKAFLTRSDERYRPSYGRKEVFEPRQCLFIGTTNKTVYLKDDSGGRRFWPVRVGKININAFERDRDQLFAEAVHLYRTGAARWPSKDFEKKYIEPQQKARYDSDAWDDIVADWLGARPDSKVTVQMVAREAVNVQSERLATSEQNRISRAMELAGWKRCKQRTAKARWWEFNPDAENET